MHHRKNQEIFPSAGTFGTSSRPRYEHDPELFGKICRLLALDKTVPEACKRLGIQRKRASYHKDKALEQGILVQTRSKKPHAFGPGVNFYQVEKGGSGRNFPIPRCRVHTPGNAFSSSIGKLGDTVLRTEDGCIRPRELSTPGMCRLRLRYDLPISIGYTGSEEPKKATIVIDEDTLVLSPPDILVADLTNATYDDLIKSIVRSLGDNGWKVTRPSQTTPLHYAFSIDEMGELGFELLDGIRPLKRGEEEADLVIYTDRSRKGGKSGELETTDPGIASDILAILKANNRLLTLRAGV